MRRTLFLFLWLICCAFLFPCETVGQGSDVSSRIQSEDYINPPGQMRPISQRAYLSGHRDGMQWERDRRLALDRGSKIDPDDYFSPPPRVRFNARQAYSDGFSDGVKQWQVIERVHARVLEQSIESLRIRMLIALIIGAIGAVGTVLFGSHIADWLRSQLVGYFSISVINQKRIAQGVFIGTALFALLLFLTRYGFKESVPVFLLLSATVYPFYGKYLPTLGRKDEISERKLALKQVLTLFFFVAVVYVIYSVLSLGGLGPLVIRPMI